MEENVLDQRGVLPERLRPRPGTVGELAVTDARRSAGSRRIVEVHGGTAVVESTVVRGSTFNALLRAEAAASAARPDEPILAP